MKTAKYERGVQYGESKGQWTTERVVLLAGDWYLVIEPYGTRGGDPGKATRVEPISEQEAKAHLLRMGAVEIEGRA